MWLITPVYKARGGNAPDVLVVTIRASTSQAQCALLRYWFFSSRDRHLEWIRCYCYTVQLRSRWLFLYLKTGVSFLCERRRGNQTWPLISVTYTISSYTHLRLLRTGCLIDWTQTVWRIFQVAIMKGTHYLRCEGNTLTVFFYIFF